ncbi:hypothetical protein ACHHV8_14210 [Paenibacillus sp. TAB 01]|uniref:hypothetical protein n=1 Tax=Paenibacillus sp. TAB 01 TaxID=3368988 RepID=UPI00374FE8A8
MVPYFKSQEGMSAGKELQGSEAAHQDCYHRFDNITMTIFIFSIGSAATLSYQAA